MQTTTNRPTSAQNCAIPDHIHSAEGKLNELAALLGRQAAAEAWSHGALGHRDSC